MFVLVDGRPKFFIGQINGIGYTSEEEREYLIKNVEDVRIKDKPVEVDREFKEKAERLGELQLTYSKSEFIRYLSGERPIPELEMIELEKENEKLEKDLSVMQQSIISLQKQVLLGGERYE